METTRQTCYRHPDQPAGIVCQRCDRPICPQCMHQASVGFHCPECTKSGAQKVIRGPAAFVVKPVLTQVLIAVNVVVFVLGVVLVGSEAATGGISQFHVDLGLMAKLWERGGDLFIGPVPGSELIGVGGGQWYRMVTSGFLHFGVLHILVNMYALWILGRAIETMGGRVRMGLIYAISLLGGSVGALVVEPQGVTAGASGAIFGLMGALFLAHRSRGIGFRDSPLLGILIINIVITIGVPGISLGGHLGGLVTGGLAGWLLFDYAPRPNVGDRVAYAICGGLLAALTVAGVVYATAFQPSF